LASYTKHEAERLAISTELNRLRNEETTKTY